MFARTTKKVEELDEKMSIEIGAVKAMMLNRFSGVDQKLTAIEQLLRKITETQNQIGIPMETRISDHEKKDRRKGGVEPCEIQDKGKQVVMGEGECEGGPSPESEAEKPCSDEGVETNYQMQGPRGGLYFRDVVSRDYGNGGWGPPLEVDDASCDDKRRWPKYGPDFGIERNFCRPAWVGMQEFGFGKKNGPCFPEGFLQKVAKADVNGWDGKKYENDSEFDKAGRDENFVDSLKSDGCGTRGLSDPWNKTIQKTDVDKAGRDENFVDSLKSDGCETRGLSDPWNKTIQKTDVAPTWNKAGKLQSVVASDSPQNEIAVKLHEEITKPGSSALKYQKRKQRKRKGKHPNCCPVGADGQRSSGQMMVQVQLMSESPQNEMTAQSGSMESDKGNNKPQVQVAHEGPNVKGHENSEKAGCGGRMSWDGRGAKRKRLDMFTSDEQNILIDIEPIMQSIQTIMHQNGYNDGDPISADDQTYILDNVFNHHPEKAQKMGGDGVDYIMIAKHKKFQESRCFYAVLNGRKEEFSFKECLENFLRGKYPDKVDQFMLKYFDEPQPYPPENRDHGSGSDVVRTPLFGSGLNLKFSAAADETGTPHAQSGSNCETSVASDDATTPASGWNLAGSVIFKKKLGCGAPEAVSFLKRVQ